MDIGYMILNIVPYLIYLFYFMAFIALVILTSYRVPYGEILRKLISVAMTLCYVFYMIAIGFAYFNALSHTAEIFLILSIISAVFTFTYIWSLSQWIIKGSKKL